MNISFFEVAEEEEKGLKSEFRGSRLLFSDQPLSLGNAESAKNSEVISVFIYSKITKEILDKLPKLKMIATRSTGYDHIDLNECRKKGVAVCSVPFYGENTVAEFAFGLILSLSRNIHKSTLRILGGDFSIAGLEGFDLKGKTIGVIGVGSIGRHVIKIASGFEMNILATSPRKDKGLQRKFKFRYAPLKTLLKKSDIVTLHVPLTPETRHMINSSTIKLMKPGAILINTSRGEVVDTKALLSALENNRIKGAGLDVIEGEAEIKEEKQLLHESGKEHQEKLKIIIDSYEILRNEKVIFTPHIAFYTEEALRRIMKTSTDNIKCFIKRKPQNVISS